MSKDEDHWPSPFFQRKTHPYAAPPRDLITLQKLQDFRNRVKEDRGNTKLVTQRELLALIDFCEYELGRREEE
jgi:hypothetical protein